MGLEKDPAALQAIAGLDPALPHYGLIKALAAAPGGMLQQGNVNLRLVLGDATQTVTSLDGPFDVVFHDPFSPRKNPEMWTTGFFGQVYELMPPGRRVWPPIAAPGRCGTTCAPLDSAYPTDRCSTGGGPGTLGP